MTTRQMVAELQKQGHTVTYYIRKDGAILIRSIDGIRYKEAKGNARAREMLGVELAEARARQLKYATKEKKRKKKKMQILTPALEEEYNRVKKIWNKAFKGRKKKGSKDAVGYFAKSSISYAYRVYGEEEAFERIRKAELYASGYAYSENIDTLIFYLREAGELYNEPKFYDLADDVEDNRYAIREEYIRPCYETIYKIDKGLITASEAVKSCRRILRLEKKK